MSPTERKKLLDKMQKMEREQTKEMLGVYGSAIAELAEIISIQDGAIMELAEMVANLTAEIEILKGGTN